VEIEGSADTTQTPPEHLAVSHQALTPLSFLLRSAEVWTDRPAVRYRGDAWSYSAHLEVVERACETLVSEFGIRPGDRVATLLPNVPALLELHYAVPGTGAVLVPMNTRLSATDYAYILGHSGASVLVADESFREVLAPALAAVDGRPPRVSWVGADGEWEALVAGSSRRALVRPDDERTLLSINYTSGTTARPKGVMVSHRGAYLHSLGVIAEARLDVRSAYLWTLPMFHCNGWAYTWAVTAAGGTHVCLRQVDPTEAWRVIQTDGITHMCAAPTVVVMLLEAPEARAVGQPMCLFVGGAPPAPALLQRAADLNIHVTHLYGLTETYGPIAVCAWNPEWDLLPPAEQTVLRARQGVATVVSERIRVVDEAMNDVPADGIAVGEIVMRGNNVMLGYYRDPEATSVAFHGGWFHSGDVGVMHPDHRVEIRDRLKDVIISGGENVSSVEVEQALMAHQSVAEAAVVAEPDDKWGEVVVAFVVPRAGRQVEEEEIRAFARDRLAHFKVPKRVHVVHELPKTGTGKIQKFRLREQIAASPG
jgi:fatty-acyl-CoA synthase